MLPYFSYRLYGAHVWYVESSGAMYIEEPKAVNVDGLGST